MKTIYELQELVNIARSRSPYYKELYKDLGHNPKINDIPIIDQDSFWQANNPQNNKLLTESHRNGIVFKSGGTTGNPKFSYFTKQEWKVFTDEFGSGMDRAGFEAGDRVANLFYAGELYASFVFIMKSIEAMQTPVIHFPLSGAAPFEQIVKSIEELGVNVLAGVPTTMMNFIAYLQEHKKKIKIDKIFFGGEDLYDDQREKLKKIFGDIKISSIGYASVDGGHLGFVDSSCGPSVHYTFNKTSIMQIIDEESGEEITELHRPGKLIYTNLTRSLMPIIRYPVGDRAEWVGKEQFRLLGRSSEGARVGPVTVNRDDVHHILEKFPLNSLILGFQLRVTREEGLDLLTLVLGASDPILLQNSVSDLIQYFYRERPMFKELVDLKMICPLQIEVLPFSGLEKNVRTGKLKLVIDLRKD
ncbi:MAG: phenylacetate--CoA ligase [Bdellovibrio sp.]